MRALVLALPLLLLIAAPADAFRCAKTRTGPPVRAALFHPYPGTSLRVCDRRTGRSVRLAHGSLIGNERPVGTEIVDVSVDGRRVAWTYSRISRRHVTIVLREVIVGRRIQRVARRILYNGPRQRSTGAQIGVSARGDLAWTTMRAIALKPAGGAVRIVARGGGDLGFEDGRTLRIEAERYSYIDLRPPPQRDGCPVRKRWRRIGASDRVLVTSAFYGSYYGEGQVQVVRVCLRGSGQDPVVAKSRESVEFESTDAYGVVAFDGHWVVLFHEGGVKDLEGVEFNVVDAATGVLGRRAMLGAWDGETYISAGVDDKRMVVTERGVPAWISTENGMSRLLAISSGITVFDRGPAGSLANLRTDGPRVTWTNAGEPRSAEPG